MVAFSDGRSSWLPKGAKFGNDQKTNYILTGHFDFLLNNYSYKKRRKKRFKRKNKFLLKRQCLIYNLDQKVNFGDELFSKPTVLQFLTIYIIDAEYIYKELGWEKGLPGIFQDLHFLLEKAVNFKNRTINFTEDEVSIKCLNQIKFNN
jgi:hypothetical protein